MKQVTDPHLQFDASLQKNIFLRHTHRNQIANQSALWQIPVRQHHDVQLCRAQQSIHQGYRFIGIRCFKAPGVDQHIRILLIRFQCAADYRRFLRFYPADVVLAAKIQLFDLLIQLLACNNSNDHFFLLTQAKGPQWFLRPFWFYIAMCILM